MTLSWIYSTGFPKSLDVSKSLAKRAGGNLRAREAVDFMRSERERLGLTRIELETRIFGRSDGNVRNWEDGISIPRPGLWPKIRGALELSITPFDADMERGDAVVREVAGSYGYQKDGVRWTEIHELREPTTDLARQWEGWGTSLKPAHEPILLFQKPLYSAEPRTESLPMIDLFPDDKTRWLIHNGDCLEVLKGMPDESVDSIVSDPPYGLSGHSATDVQDALRAWLEGKPYTPGALRKGQKNCSANILWDTFIADTDGSNPGSQQEYISFTVFNELVPAMSFSGINLNHESSIREVEIGNESSTLPLKDVLVGDRETQFSKTRNSYPFSLRKRQGFSCCVGICSCHAQTSTSFYHIDVWLRYDPLRESERASREVALTGTEVRAVLSLDMAKKTAQVSLAEVTPDHDCGLILLPSHLVGALTGAGSLSSEGQSSGVGLVGRSTNGTSAGDERRPSNNPAALLAASSDASFRGVEGLPANFTVLLHTEYLTRLSSPTLDKKGFMGKSWDSFVPGPEVWRECFRVLKPGGHLLAFAGTRTQDLMGIAIRLAGFDCRDEIRVEGVLGWHFGSGFPKSLSVGKAIDKTAGAEREVTGPYRTPEGGQVLTTLNNWQDESIQEGTQGRRLPMLTTPTTDAAKQWEGWGTALKPAHEPVLMYRKPLAGTVAQTVQQHGTGAINIDGCRVGLPFVSAGGNNFNAWRDGEGREDRPEAHQTGSSKEAPGRWPSNLVLCHTPDCKQAGTKTVEAPVINRFDDGMKPFGKGAGHAYTSTGGGQEEIPVWECVDGCPVKALDGQSGEAGSWPPAGSSYESTVGLFGKLPAGTHYGDSGGASGGASRFFPQFQYTPEDAPFRYVPKTGRAERNEGLDGKAAKQVDESRDSDAPGANNPRNRGGRSDENHHPTVKPIELMRWLVRLVTQPGGVVLDPFNGSGSTGCAAILEGMRYVGIELDPDYAEIARTRIAHHELKGRGGIKNPWASETREEIVADQQTTSMAGLFGFEDE